MLHFKRKYDKLETIYHYFRHFGTLSQRIKGEKNMFSRVLSAAICGIQGLPIFVEADVSEGLPGFSMVGDLSAKVKEAQDRVMSISQQRNPASSEKNHSQSLSGRHT